MTHNFRPIFAVIQRFSSFRGNNAWSQTVGPKSLFLICIVSLIRYTVRKEILTSKKFDEFDESV